MKILFATPHLFPDKLGGSGLHSRHLIRHLAHAGHAVDVLHPYRTRHFPALPQVREYRVPFGRNVFAFASRVRAWIGDAAYDVGYSDGLSLLRYVKDRAFPCIVNDHGFAACQAQYFGGYLKASGKAALRDVLLRGPRLWARRHIAREADFVVSMGGLTDDVVAHALGVPEARILRLPNAVDVETWPAVEPGDARDFLFVGRIEYPKGVAQLLQAFKRLRGTEARLRLVGDGAMAAAVQGCGLSNVEWVGPRFGQALLQEYRAAGCAVFPSLQEGMPTVVLEAMSQGKTVIASDVGANRELVTRDAGFLIAPHDASALVDALTACLHRSAAARVAAGQAGQARVRDRYTWQRVGPRYVDGFLRAAGTPRPNARRGLSLRAEARA